jgi:glycosyltransferase involved in cell wall biosynthesis
MKLLLATYNFPPENYGGTEVYVRALAGELIRRGHQVQVLAGSNRPAAGEQRFEMREDIVDGLAVHRLLLAGARFSKAELYATRAADLDAFWPGWLAALRPDVLHLHGHSLAISNSLLAAARDLGIPILATVHHLALLCPRSDYITWRGDVCDGRIELAKCSQCVVATHSGSALAGQAVGALVPLLARLPAPAGGPRWRTALGIPVLLELRFAARREMIAAVRLWHVFSDWSQRALETNGVPAERIVLCRHPLPGPVARRERTPRGGPLRLGFFGRFQPAKGLGVLLDAVALAPRATLRVAVFGEAQTADEQVLARRLAGARAHDPRIEMRGQFDYAQLSDLLAELDAVIVPSLTLETGPLTVLEAFAAGLPVLGSDVSGINEWVRHGENGLLFRRGDAGQLGALLGDLAAHPERLRTLGSFPALQTVAEHAGWVETLYDRAVGSAGR